MVKPEWGLKRLCPSCGTRYYDMRRDPVICPKCGAAFDPEALLKSRRTRVQPVVAAEEATEPMADEEIDADIDTEAAESEEEEALPIEGEGEAGEEEEEEEEIIEDASELGEDEDDMAEVIENVEDEDER